MGTPSPDWLTQDEVATRLGVNINKVRPVVAALSNVRKIQTRTNPKDNRYILVHISSLDVIKKALGIP